MEEDDNPQHCIVFPSTPIEVVIAFRRLWSLIMDVIGPHPDEVEKVFMDLLPRGNELFAPVNDQDDFWSESGACQTIEPWDIPRLVEFGRRADTRLGCYVSEAVYSVWVEVRTSILNECPVKTPNRVFTKQETALRNFVDEQRPRLRTMRPVFKDA